MRKRNKLYTANRWNQPLFADNIFDDGGNLLGFDKAASKAYGASYGDAGHTLQDYMGSTNFLGISKAANPFSKGNLANTFSASGIGGALKGGAAGAIGGLVGNVGGKLLSGGLNSGAGNAISSIGGTLGSAVGTVNPVLGAAVSAASGIIGGGVNALFGTKTDQKKLNAANEGTNYLNSFTSNAASFDDIQGPNAQANVQNAFKGGVFKKGWARRKNAELREQRQSAESWANRSVDNNIDNIADTQMDNLMANYAAFGGPLDSQGAIDYGFMSDYLTTKNKANSIKDKVGTNIFGSLASTPIFALGGDLQSNGTDWSTGLSIVDAGGSHSENPYGGIQVGRDSDGTPNLVEEGETIFDDYVFSNRIKVDKQTKDRFHLGKNTDMTYADLSKKIQKENEERPNDAIAQRGMTKQLHDLADEQERQKNEEQAQRAQEMFNSLPPEQQAEIMQQMAMQEQQAQEAAQQEVQQGMEQQPMQEGMQQPNEQQMVEQQQMEQPMTDNGEMNACGGKINKYDKGGDMKKRIYGLLGLHTDSDFDKWANEHKMPKVTDWENALSNRQLMEAISGANPALADVISRGYDFGTYVPSKNKGLTFDFTHGGWGAEDYNAWNGSKDAAWQEAVKKGLVKEGMNSEEIGKALSQTDAYKRGTDWLKDNEDNRLNYLQQIYNSKDAPQAARDYAAKYVDGNGWLKDAKRDYQTIFEDPNGTGVRNTHPGTYWKTPNEVLRDRQTNNYVVNADGTVEEIIGNVPKEWNKTDNYTWADDKSDYAANYYQRPVVTGNDDGTNGDDEGTVTPVHKPTWGRYAGLFGPAVGLGLQALGVGKPDYSGLDAALEVTNGAPALAHYKPIGNYLAYNPMDIWYEQNRMNANSRATDRAILNNASPIGTKMAGLLANGYNSQIASGDLYRKALEYNDAQRQKVAEFNRGTDMYNADAFTKTSATNAEILNRQRQLQASMTADNTRQRMAADAAWNQGIYGNVQGLFKGLSDWGKENAQHNMIADMAADGIFGVGSGDNQYTFRKYTRKASKGGKIRRKRGLTF